MMAIPAVDLRGGACVQLVGGSPAAERVRLADPVAAAREWERIGFSRLHVVDLDAAFGVGSNADVVRDIVAATSATTQIGGGVRSNERVAELLEDGAQSVIVGTRAIEDRGWLDALARRYPGRLLVAVDVRYRQVVVRGWAQTLPLNVLDVVRTLGGLPLAGLLVTAVHREGQMGGPECRFNGRCRQSCHAPGPCGRRDRDARRPAPPRGSRRDRDRDRYGALYWGARRQCRCRGVRRLK